MENFFIMAVKIEQRRELATTVQEILTEFGCIIKMRLGLHEAGSACSNQGLIILELTPDKNEIDRLLKTLQLVDGVNAQLMEI